MLSPAPGRQVVYVRPIFDAEFPRGIDDGLAHRRPFGHWGSCQKPCRSMRLAYLALPVLGPLEIGQYVIPAPAAIAELCPIIEIFGLTANVDETVDR
jgi:hypothetical protein